MSFPQLPFGGLRSRRVSFLNSDLVLQPLQLQAIAGELKYANSDLDLANTQSQASVGEVNVGEVKSVTSALEIPPIQSDVLVNPRN